MERPPEAKKDEQYPLLKEGGGVKETAVPAPVQVPTWTVTCAPKQAWLRKCWPEVISASWLTLILLGSTFILFYSLGIGACRKSQLLLGMKDNEAKPASNVYLHHIVESGYNFQFGLYAPFLSSLSVTYPNLQFNLLLLADDAMRSSYFVAKHSKSYSGLLGYQLRDARDILLKQEAKEFQRRHPNVNITFMTLSKLMATTPLKSYWRTIPVSYLSFYIRIFSVWENSGIGMDLHTHSNIGDPRISEILKNHNEGLPVTDYNVLLQTIDEEEANCFKTLNQIMNDTLSMFNNIFSFSDSFKITDLLPSAETPAKRTQRAKRDINNNFYETETNNVNNSSLDKNIVEIKFNNSEDDKLDKKIENNTLDNPMITGSPTTKLEMEQLDTTKMDASLKPDQETAPKLISVEDNNVNEDNKRRPKIMVFDFSFANHDIGRFNSREPLWPFIPARFGFNSKRDTSTVAGKNERKNSMTATKLALASDGRFVASVDKMHSFLGFLLISTNFQRKRPECAIQDTLLAQCTGINRDVPYCNIYGL